MKRLDPAWWRKVAGGYAQGEALLVRIKNGSKISWSLQIDGEYRANWPTLSLAKRRAAEITNPKPWETAA
jgi:hypothetical protein